MSEPNVDRDPFEVVAESFLARYRAGERPGIEEYAARHPELADEIRELLPALVMVEQDLSIDPDPGHASNPGRATRVSSPDRERRLGDYRILREIGRGGMGVVYEAEQVSLGRRVALKVLPRHVAGDGMALERFRREAKAAARLHHTNIVPVFEVGREGDLAYYAMQFIQGQGLDQVIDELARLCASERKPGGAEGPGPNAAAGPGLRAPASGRIAESLLSGRFTTGGAAPICDDPRAAVIGPIAGLAHDVTHKSDFALANPGPITPPAPSVVLPGGSQLSPAYLSSKRAPYFRSVAQLGRQAAQGLAYAHASGIVHRDIKPSNLLLDHAGVVWIADFGLAKGDEAGLTRTGDILGTLRYMAPERFRGEGDARADVYALGLTLYELLTLYPGFDSSDRLKLIEQIKGEEPRKPRSCDARIPRDLETIVLKAIEKDPKARYQSAETMAEDLWRFLADEPIRARQVTAQERYWRWARRNPTIAVLGGVLTALLIAATVGSMLTAGRFANLAEDRGKLADAERSARLEADQARDAARADRYVAVLSKVKALRAGRQPGWRDEALAELSRLAVMPTPRRDLVELRTEAVATLGTPDVRLVARIEFSSDHLRSTAFSRDGRTLVTASIETDLNFWDVRGLRHLDSAQGLRVSEGTSALELGSGYPKAVYLAHDQGLAVATQDQGVVFTDARGIRTARAPITRGASKPIRLAIDAEGRRIVVSWTDGGGITVHDTASGTLLHRFDSSGNPPFAISPDGRWLARQELADVVLHPIGTGESRVVLARNHAVRALTFSHNGAVLAGACSDHTTMLWDVAGRKPFGTLRGHRERVTAVAFSPDGEWIATTSGDYTTRIWETRTGQTLATLPGAGDMDQVDWSPDGNEIAATTKWHRTVFLYRINGRRDVQQWLTGPGHEAVAVASHPRNEQFTTLLSNGSLIAWDMSAPRNAHRQIGSEFGQGNALAYSPDGTLLAAASTSRAAVRTILVQDVRSGEIRGTIQCPDSPSALAFDESGQWVASGDDSGNLVVWNLATNRSLRQLTTGSAIRSIAFLDGGRRLVTHGHDSVLLCDLQTGEVERRVRLQEGIRRFVVDRQRSRLVVAHTSGVISSLSLPDLTPGHRLENAHHGSVECLALSPDGRLVATGGEDHRVVLRDPLTFEPLLNFPVWTRTLRDMAFDCASRRLAIVGTDSDLELWNIAALEDGLTNVGLAWDRPTAVTAPQAGTPMDGAAPTAAVVVIRPGNMDPAEVEQAQRLLQSGIAALQQRRFEAAEVDLQGASERFQALRQSRPRDPELARQQGSSLGCLASTLRNLKRPGEALVRARGSLASYEILDYPYPDDLYRMACDCAMLSVLNDQGPPDEREKLEARAVGYLRRAIENDQGELISLLASDRDLDPLRSRADFRDLLADASFPRHPFATAPGSGR
jgi:WD40 repeat protein